MSSNDSRPFDIDGYLGDRDGLFSRCITYASDYAKLFSLTLHFDECALKTVIGIFANTFRQNFDLTKGEPGHIKMFGHLLYCLTQLPGEIEGRRIISFDLVSDAVNTDSNLDEITKVTIDFANEQISFAFVFAEFHRFQNAREIDAYFDLKDPPMHWRYVRSMIDYLRPWAGENHTGTRHSWDFYMILKTMDLFSMKTDYSTKS